MHLLPARVYVADTDAGGVMYHGNYLNFLERGRSEFLRLRGIDHSALISPKGDSMVYAVVRLEIDYRAPARLDDELVIGTRLNRMRAASFEARQWIWRDSTEGELLAEARIVVATLDSKGRLARMPAAIHTKLTETISELNKEHT